MHENENIRKSIKYREQTPFAKKLLQKQKIISKNRNEIFTQKRMQNLPKYIFLPENISKNITTKRRVYNKYLTNQNYKKTIKNVSNSQKQKISKRRNDMFSQRRKQYTTINIPVENKVIATPSVENKFFDFIENMQTIGEKIYQETGIEYINKNNLFYSIIIGYLLKKYNRDCFILGKDMKVINFMYMENNNVFKEDLTQKITWLIKQLLNCINKNKDNPNYFVIIPIAFYAIEYKKLENGKLQEVSMNHANMLVYKHNTLTLEHFEPHGAIFYGNLKHFSKLFYKTVQTIVNKMNAHNTAENHKFYDKNIKYIRPSSLCPLMGFQLLEETYDTNTTVRIKERSGFCVMWSAFFAELVLLNPTIDSNQLLTTILSKIKEKPQYNLYVRNIIRGYVHTIYEGLNNILKENLGMNIIEIQKQELTKEQAILIEKYIESDFEKINQMKFDDTTRNPISIEISIPSISLSKNKE